jgi:hypothetical protein
LGGRVGGDKIGRHFSLEISLGGRQHLHAIGDGRLTLLPGLNTPVSEEWKSSHKMVDIFEARLGFDRLQAEEHAMVL